MAIFWLRVAAVLYGVAALAVLPATLYARPRWRYLAMPAAIGAVLFHFVAMVETFFLADHAMPVDTHETLSMLGLLLGVAFLVLAWRWRTLSFGIFLLPAAAVLALVPAFHPGHETLSYSLVGHGWVLLHVALLLAAYAALFLSLLAGVLYLVQERRLKAKRSVSRSWLPPLETTDQISLRALLFGLPCMTAGLLIGCGVALETVGPSFFSDPKVLLSFAMWFAYVLMIFIRRREGLRGRRAVYLSSSAFLLVIAVWGANLLSNVHRFKAP
jgi:ABC-type uncharacterized transport system permease subunit